MLGVLNRRSGLIMAVLAAGPLLCLAATPTSSDSALLTQIERTIVKARTGEDVQVRTDAAERLSFLAHRIDPNKLDDKTLADLVSLLDSPNDSVRYWVATALANIGPRARVAVPKLEALLPSADCLNGAITSASAIRRALIRMGIKPPPPPKNCNPIAG